MKAMSRLSGIFSATAVSLAVGILASSVVAVAPASASGIAPSAYTRGVSAVGATTAVLEGKVTDQSSSASTVTFCLSTSYTTTAGALTCSITTSTPTLATYSGSTNVTNGSQTGDMASLSVGSLTRGTAYYYQLVATNSFGTSHGKVVEVTTDNQSAYENTVSVSPPPAGSFSGSSGGDGWMLTFSSANVFTVFHQNPSGSNELTASCHNETSTSACAGWNGVDGTGTLPIYDSAHPTASLYPSADESVYFDPTNSYLYVWAVENLSSVYTMGVIGINTLTPTEAMW